MTEKGLIKFLGLSNRRNAKDVLVTLGKKLEFVHSSYKDINGLFVEPIENNRFHLFLYSRDENFGERLKAVSITNNQRFYTLNNSNYNVMFSLPETNLATYKLAGLEPGHDLYEKVIQFSTGAHRNILDLLLAVDVTRHPIKYIVSNRENSFIAFSSGTDAVLVMAKLRTMKIESAFSTMYAYVDLPIDRIAEEQQAMEVDAQIHQVRAPNRRRNVANHNNNTRQHDRGNHLQNDTNRRDMPRQRNNNRQPFRQEQQARDFTAPYRGRVQQAFRGPFRGRGRNNNRGRQIQVHVPRNYSPNDYNIVFVPRNN